jgi:serine/threonine protein kinase
VEFEILGQIGRGASGRIFAAEQKLLRRKVAIKVLNQEVCDDPVHRERFLRQGWICAQVRSPYVVEVYDVRVFQGQVCLIMELVQGSSAKDRLQDGPLPVEEVLKIGEDIARALVIASAAGIVHRDIKPSNILLDPAGVAKLADFGIAKILDEEEANTEFTPHDAGLGTLAYVSPEQAAEARRVTAGSDIYCLGATLYHLLAGHPIRVPKSLSELFEMVEEPVRSLHPVLGDSGHELAELVHAMLANEPGDRPSPSQVARALQSIRLRSFAEEFDSVSTWTTAHQTGDRSNDSDDLATVG